MNVLLLLLGCSGLSPAPTAEPAPSAAGPQKVAQRPPDPRHIRGERAPDPQVFEPGDLLDAAGFFEPAVGQAQAAMLKGPAGIQVWERQFSRWSVRDVFTPPAEGEGRVAPNNTLWWFDRRGVNQPDDPAVSWRARPECPPAHLIPDNEGAWVVTACGTILRVPAAGGQLGPERPWKVDHPVRLGRDVAARVVKDGAMRLEWAPDAPGATGQPGQRTLDLGPPCPGAEPWVGLGAGASGSTVIAATCTPSELIVSLAGAAHRLSIADQLVTGHGPLIVSDGAPVAVLARMGELLRLLAWNDEDLAPVEWVKHDLPAGASIEVPKAARIATSKASITLDIIPPEGFQPRYLLPGKEAWTLIGTWPIDGKPMVTALEIDKPEDPG